MPVTAAETDNESNGRNVIPQILAMGAGTLGALVLLGLLFALKVTVLPKVGKAMQSFGETKSNDDDTFRWYDWVILFFMCVVFIACFLVAGPKMF